MNTISRILTAVLVIVLVVAVSAVCYNNTLKKMQPVSEPVVEQAEEVQEEVTEIVEAETAETVSE